MYQSQLVIVEVAPTGLHLFQHSSSNSSWWFHQGMPATDIYRLRIYIQMLSNPQNYHQHHHHYWLDMWWKVEQTHKKPFFICQDPVPCISMPASSNMTFLSSLTGSQQNITAMVTIAMHVGKHINAPTSRVDRSNQTPPAQGSKLQPIHSHLQINVFPLQLIYLEKSQICDLLSTSLYRNKRVSSCHFAAT